MLDLGRSAAALCSALLAGAAFAQSGIARAPEEKAILLIAHPAVRHLDYRDTVVVVSPVRGDIRIGVILNRPTKRTLSSLFPDLAPAREVPGPVYFGGPKLRRAVFALVNSSGTPGNGSVRILNDTYLATQEVEIDRIIEQAPREVQIYVGYASWRPDELQREIGYGRWVWREAAVEDVRRKNADGWSAVVEDALAPRHPEARALWDVARGHQKARRYTYAEVYYERTARILEQALGPDHPDLASALAGLALMRQLQGDYAAAEPSYVRALSIREKVFGPEHVEVVATLTALGSFYRAQKKYAAAEGPYRRAVSISEKIFGEEDPNVASPPELLGRTYADQRHYADAEPAFRRAVAIYEKAYGLGDHASAQPLNNLGAVYYEQRQYTQAEPLMKSALQILEKRDPDHPDVAITASNLANVYRHQARYEEAMTLYERSLMILERVRGPDHPEVADQLSEMAALYAEQRDYASAAALVRRAMAIRERSLGSHDGKWVASAFVLQDLYLRMGRAADALQILNQLSGIGSPEPAAGDPQGGGRSGRALGDPP